ncbi:MAG: hypothetical protein Unbinned4026contig1003_18 [Prokaryotic dsDNA virus sp.]|nr:MAG: hypothetical protein Unbinned4026contig1003_18 [Prokaryotic dsDNA virus sp.]|tara:strand:- start:21652 stop:22101 length:450 start_codon:yes stop_codon:yes gene_type:complete
MADLTTTITESLVLNGANRGTTNNIVTTGITDVLERILTCAHSNTTTIATFGSTPHSSAGALDVENCKYVRVTNLSADQDIKLALVTTNTNYQVTVRAGSSHILFQAENGAIGETDTSPAFGTLEDITSIQVRPSASTDVQVEIFVALV